MATLQDYLGITSLRDAWPKWKANVIAINNQVIAHIAGTADKHSAQDITYTGDFTGKTDVKAAIDQAKTEIDTIVVNASIDPEVAFARDSAVKSKVFGSLDARLEEDEQDFESYKAETAILVNVKAFGAKGYPFDDSAPFQSAIDYAIANNYDVFVPDGTYTFKDVTITNNVRIEGSTNTIFKPMIKDDNPDCPHNMFSAISIDYVSLKNIKFIGDTETDPTATATPSGIYGVALLFFDTVKVVNLTNCHFGKISYAGVSSPDYFNNRRGMITAIDCDLIRIKECEFTKIWRNETTWIITRTDKMFRLEIDGILVTGYEPGCYSPFGVVGGSVLVRGCTFKDNTNINSTLDVLSKHVEVINNTFDNLSSTIIIDTTEGGLFYADTARITGNSFKNCLTCDAVNFQGGSLEFHSNSMFEIREGIVIWNEPSDVADQTTYHPLVYTDFKQTSLVDIHNNNIDISKDVDGRGYAIKVVEVDGYLVNTGVRIIKKFKINKNKFVGLETRLGGSFAKLHGIEVLGISDDNEFINPGITFGTSTLKAFFYMSMIDDIRIINNYFESLDNVSNQYTIIATPSYDGVITNKFKQIFVRDNKSKYPYTYRNRALTDNLIDVNNECGNIRIPAVNINREILGVPQSFRGDTIPVVGEFLRGDIINKNTLSVGSSTGWAVTVAGGAYSEDRVSDKIYNPAVFLKYNDGSVWITISYGASDSVQPDIAGKVVGDVVIDGANSVYKVSDTSATFSALPII